MAITITSKAPAPTNANAAAASDATQPNMGADLFAALLGAELTQLGAGGDGAQAKLDIDPQGPKAAKEDKSAEPSGNPADTSALAFLQAVALPVAAPIPQASVNDANLTANSHIAATVQASTAPVAEDNGFLLGGPLKKLGEQTKLPQAADFAQLLQTGQLSTASHTNSASQPLTLVVQTPMQDPAWGKAFGDQMLGMVSLKADTAHIQVNPPELGPIDVTLKIDSNNQAQVSFVTSNPATRELVENHMHRLSSMLEAGGIQLTGAQVSTGQGSQQQAQQQQQRNQREGLVEESDTLAVIMAARGVLSIFA